MWFRLVVLLALAVPSLVAAEPADKPFKVAASRVVPLDRGPRLVDLEGEATELLVSRIYAQGSARPSDGRNVEYAVERIIAARPKGQHDLPWEAIRLVHPVEKEQQIGSTSLWPNDWKAAFFVLDPRRAGASPSLFVARQIYRRSPGWVEGEDENFYMENLVKAGKAQVIQGSQTCDHNPRRYWFELYQLRRQVNPDTGRPVYFYEFDGRFRSRNFYCYIGPDQAQNGLIEAFDYERR